MGERKGACRRRSADLHRDDHLALLARSLCRGEKLPWIGNAFEVAKNETELRLNGEIVDELARGGADLAAAGGEIADLEIEFVQCAVERSAHRAALGDDRDRAWR